MRARREVRRPGMRARRGVRRPGMRAHRGVRRPGMRARRGVRRPGMRARRGVRRPGKEVMVMHISPAVILCAQNNEFQVSTLILVMVSQNYSVVIYSATV